MVPDASVDAFLILAVNLVKKCFQPVLNSRCVIKKPDPRLSKVSLIQHLDNSRYFAILDENPLHFL
jgi:hypothetical protein